MKIIIVLGVLFVLGVSFGCLCMCKAAAWADDAASRIERKKEGD